MSWAVLIQILIQIFGPMLDAWVKKCIEKRAKQVADNLGQPDEYETPSEARRIFFEELQDSLPRGAFARRALLAHVAHVCEEHDITFDTNPAAIVLPQDTVSTITRMSSNIAPE